MTTGPYYGDGTAIILADTTDHSPATKNNLGTRTDQIDLTSLASGSYRQSAKVDFGATRGVVWVADGAIEPVSAPTAGGEIELYIGWSASATAGQDNPGNLSGSDGAYVGYGAAATDATECINQLDRIGSFPMSADAAIQVGRFGVFLPKKRYGIIVVRNRLSVNLAGDAVEMSIRLAPLELAST